MPRYAANAPQPMAWDGASAWFKAEGIPITPWDDADSLNSYPLMRLVARDVEGERRVGRWRHRLGLCQGHGCGQHAERGQGTQPWRAAAGDGRRGTEAVGETADEGGEETHQQHRHRRAEGKQLAADV